jgi:hypothetical protein
MVTVLAARWMLGADLYRETGDADLGVTPVLARSIHLSGRLKALGYQQVAGNRFARRVPDIPVTLAGVKDAPRQAVIDILIPAYTGRARQNVKISDDLVATEVPGLAAALGRPAVIMTLELERLAGEILHAALPFPDEVSRDLRPYRSARRCVPMTRDLRGPSDHGQARPDGPGWSVLRHLEAGDVVLGHRVRVIRVLGLLAGVYRAGLAVWIER